MFLYSPIQFLVMQLLQKIAGLLKWTLSKFKPGEMKKLFLLFFLMHHAGMLHAQNSTDTLQKEQIRPNADDPSQFLTRIEVFNELQHYDKNGNDFYINQAVVRTIFREIQVRRPWRQRERSDLRGFYLREYRC